MQGLFCPQRAHSLLGSPRERTSCWDGVTNATAVSVPIASEMGKQELLGCLCGRPEGMAKD